MNKEKFTQLLDMGYSALEALDLLNDAPAAEPTPTPTPEPAPAPEPEPTPEPEQPTPDPAQYIREEMKAYNDAVLKSINDLTKAIQRMNIRTAGTDENPGDSRAEEFLQKLVQGGK